MISTKSEQNINKLLSQFKNDVDKWYLKILIKSIVLCVLFFIFIYLIIIFFSNSLIGTGLLSVVIVSIFYVFIYIVHIYNNENKFKKDILHKAHDYVNKYSIHYESVYCY